MQELRYGTAYALPPGCLLLQDGLRRLAETLVGLLHALQELQLLPRALQGLLDAQLLLLQLYGLLAGLAYGVLQYLQGGWFANVWQFALDYLLAFAALGLTGVAKHLPEKWGLYCAMVIAALCRALSATLAGIMFWDTAPWASLVYNGTYLIPDTLICIVLAILIAKPVMKVLKAK